MWLILLAWTDGLLRVLWLVLIGLGWWFCWFGLHVAWGVCGAYLLARGLGGLVHSGVCVFPVLLLVGLDNVIMMLVNSVADFVSLCCLGFILVVGLLGF